MAWRAGGTRPRGTRNAQWVRPEWYCFSCGCSSNLAHWSWCSQCNKHWSFRSSPKGHNARQGTSSRWDQGPPASLFASPGVQTAPVIVPEGAPKEEGKDKLKALQEAYSKTQQSIKILTGASGNESVVVTLEAHAHILQMQIEEITPKAPPHETASKLLAQHRKQRKQVAYLKDRIAKTRRALQNLQDKFTQAKQDLASTSAQYTALEHTLPAPPSDPEELSEASFAMQDTQLDTDTDGMPDLSRQAKRRRARKPNGSAAPTPAAGGD